MPKPLKAAIIFTLSISLLGIICINYYLGTLGKKDNLLLGEGDFTLDMYGWKKVKTDIDLIIKKDIESGLMKSNATIISNKWFPAAHIDFYIAMPLKKDLLAIADTSDIHQYAWINRERHKLKKGDDAYCIVPSNYYFDATTVYKNMFAKMVSPQIILQYRNGVLCRKFYLWRLKNYQ